MIINARVFIIILTILSECTIKTLAQSLPDSTIKKLTPFSLNGTRKVVPVRLLQERCPNTKLTFLNPQLDKHSEVLLHT